MKVRKIVQKKKRKKEKESKMELEYKSIPLNYLYSGPIPMVAKTKPCTHKYRTTWVHQNTDSGLNFKK